MWQPGELYAVNDLLKKASVMTRQDFLAKRKERLNPDRESKAQFRVSIDIESKDFIKRDESGGELMQFNINQPMIEKKAVVARSISQEDSNFEYDRTGSRFYKGKNSVKVKSNINPNFANFSRN